MINDINAFCQSLVWNPGFSDERLSSIMHSPVLALFESIPAMVRCNLAESSSVPLPLPPLQRPNLAQPSKYAELPEVAPPPLPLPYVPQVASVDKGTRGAPPRARGLLECIPGTAGPKLPPLVPVMHSQCFVGDSSRVAPTCFVLEPCDCALENSGCVTCRLERASLSAMTRACSCTTPSFHSLSYVLRQTYKRFLPVSNDFHVLLMQRSPLIECCTCSTWRRFPDL